MAGYTVEVRRRLAVFGCIAYFAYAQDPYSTLPSHYRIEFENEFVRVSRVKYSPGDKLPAHSHPANPTVYVYLNEGGPVRYIHTSPPFTLERPPVKAGSVRFNRNAQVETHEVHYLGESATEYLRIELKTKPGPRHRDARLRNEADFPWEDEQVRISRMEKQPARLNRPAIVVDVGARSFQWFDPNEGTAARQYAGGIVIVELKTGVERNSQ